MPTVTGIGRRCALALLTCLCLLLCPRAFGSVFVGNPTNVTLAPIPGIVLTGSAFPLAMVETRACGASTGTRTAPAVVNGAQEIYIPDGTCQLRLEVDDAVLVSGYATSGGAPISLELELPATVVLLFAEPFDAANETDRYLVELGMPGWTSAAELLPNGATSAFITPAHALHDDLVDALVAGTAVFANPNGDGVVNAGERTPGPLAETP
jgi:hypothetical protein